MKIVKTTAQLNSVLASTSGSIGFVPTMGALHAGHLSLVETAAKSSDKVVVSIFVNPTQFNDPKDLEKYPRTLEADCQMLDQAGVDVVFAPTVEQIYPSNSEIQNKFFDFGSLDKVMEGIHRPGHFAGVAQVVDRLFDIVKPRYAFFGEKDFQQLAIIRALEKMRGDKIQIIGCPIIREPDGLAMSSRNMLLDQDHRSAATQIYKAISKAVTLNGTPSQIEHWATIEIDKNPLLKTAYINIVDKYSLQKIDKITKNCQLCAAVLCGDVRLIDNISF